MKKILLLISLFLFGSSNFAFAGNNLIVTCNPTTSSTGKCDVSPAGQPLFSETDFKPSYNAYQRLTVINNSVGDNCALYLKATKKTDPANLSAVLLNNIYRSSIPLYTGLMSSLLSSTGPVYLDTVPNASTNTYDWKLTMDPNAGNNYQDKHFEFDLSLTFQCGQEPLITGVILNEIMLDPPTGNEWVEFYNQNSFPVTLINWDIGRSSSGTRNIDPPLTIPANGYAVFETAPGYFSNSSGFGRLINNSGTEVDRSDLYTYTSTILSWSRQPDDSWCHASPTYNTINNPCYAPTPTNPPGPGPGPNPGPPTCNDLKPGTPTNLTATQNSIGQVTLTWNQIPQPFTSYLIAYGPTLGDYRYGNPDVGTGNSYVVSYLTPGAQYCFYVRAQNGCQPGDRSNEVCINAGSLIIPIAPPPAGFLENVLGEQTQAPSISGETEGVSTATCPRRWLPILYFIAFFLNLFYLHRQADKKPDDRSVGRFVFPFILPILALLIDWYFLRNSCCWIVPTYCRYFWIGNILSFLAPVWFYNKIKEK